MARGNRCASCQSALVKIGLAPKMPWGLRANDVQVATKQTFKKNGENGLTMDFKTIRPGFMTIAVMVLLTVNYAAFAAERSPAKKGEPVTPPNFSPEWLQGLNQVGAIPEKQYVIAFSNGDLSNSWSFVFARDIIKLGQIYADRFGMRLIWTNAHANSYKQLEDVKNLLAQKPDLLIISPNESMPLTIIDQWCTKAGVPLVCIDRGIDTEPGRQQSSYISLIQMDNFKLGMANGISVVKKLTKKYGEPKGNLIEIPGILGSSPAIQRSIGQRWVLKNFPKIRIVAMSPGDYERKKSYEAARDILEKWPKGTIDGMIGGCDESGIAFLKAAEDTGRTELFGYIWGVDGSVRFLEKIIEGKVEQSSEYSPFYAIITLEYAIQYLNGNSIPPVIIMPFRDYQANSPAQKDKLKEFVKYCISDNLEFVPMELGGLDIFQTDPDKIEKYYPVPFYKDPKVLEELKRVQPYAVEPPYTE